MKRKEELEIIIPKVRNDISAHGQLLAKASGHDSDFCLPELKSAIADLETYVAEYKKLNK